MRPPSASQEGPNAVQEANKNVKKAVKMDAIYIPENTSGTPFINVEGVT